MNNDKPKTMKVGTCTVCNEDVMGTRTTIGCACEKHTMADKMTLPASWEFLPKFAAMFTPLRIIRTQEGK